MPRFVILKHVVGPQAHYDLMLERGKVLKTWSLEAPLAGLVCHLPARQRFDHPTRFLTFEGPLTEGNGTVEALDRGTYQPLQWRTGADVFVDLCGQTCIGRLRLTHRKGETWELGFLASPPPPPGTAAPRDDDQPPDRMRVGEVARRCGLSREVINSYAMFGLITEAERSPSGHRLFAPEVFQRLKMIGLLKQRGYTLRDIREIFLKDR